MQGEKLEEKKKERKTEIRKHNSLKHFPVLSLALALSLSLSLSLLFCFPISPWLSPPLVWTGLSLHLYVHRSPVFTVTAHPSKSFSAFLSSSVLPLLCFSSSLLCLTLSLPVSISLFISLCLLCHLSFLF